VERVVIAEVPLVETVGSVAGRREEFRECRLVRSQQGPPEVGVHDAGPVVIAPGQQTGPRRRTHRATVEPTTADALLIDVADPGRLDHGISVTARIAVDEVVGDDEHDVRGSSPPGKSVAVVMSDDR
jgi:hypothetical protein